MTSCPSRRSRILCPRRRPDQTEDNLVKIFGWYDNEWGYAAHTVELAQLMAKELPSR
jgi:glyceraldehyde-3-phosphate dehydrogenase/erythrose-4-phosphate dehydrogenase